MWALGLLLMLAQNEGVRAEWIQHLSFVAALEPDDRENAREALVKGAGGSRDLLRRLSATSDDALLILGMLGETSARANIIRLLKSEDVVIRRAATEVMSHALGDSGAIELEANLADGDLQVALAAARGLARFKRKGAADPLRKMRDDKDDRKALIAAHGLELLEPGSQTTFIRERLSHDIGYVVATNAPSVADALSRNYDTQSLARLDELSPRFEREGTDALGMLCVRSNLKIPGDALGYLKYPTVSATPWALTRVPAMRGLHTSCIAHQIVRLIEDRAKASKGADEARHVDALEGILQRRCGAAPTAGDPEARAKAYRVWFDRVRPSMVAADATRAIDRGVAWLRSRQEKDGSWRWCKCGHPAYANIPHLAGMTSFAGFTLLKMGVSPDDPSVQRAVTFVLDLPNDQVLDNQTYAFSTELMFLAEFVAKRKGSALGARALKRIQECVDWLVNNRVVIEKGGYEYTAWTYTKPSNQTHDHSNTQFAMLGLVAGQNVGAKIPHRVWETSLDHWKVEQYEEGGWYYTPFPPGTPREQLVGTVSMTGAGIASVLIAKASLKKQPTERVASEEESVKKAVAKWVKTYPVAEPGKYMTPGHNFSVYYDLYSIERAMMMAGLPSIGEKDWYHDGAVYILWNQQYDGAWLCASDTCFALLFLKKAYVSVATK